MVTLEGTFWLQLPSIDLMLDLITIWWILAKLAKLAQFTYDKKDPARDKSLSKRSSTFMLNHDSNATGIPDWFISPKVLDDKLAMDACRIVKRELLPKISNDCLTDARKFVHLIEEFSYCTKLSQETIYACIMRDPSLGQMVVTMLEQSECYKYIHNKHLGPELKEAMRRNLIKKYENGQLDTAVEENKKMAMDYEFRKLFEYIKLGYKLPAIKELLPDSQRYYDRKQTLGELLQNCKEHLYGWTTPDIIAFLQRSIPILRYVDSTMFLLDRLVKDIKINCRQRNDFYQSVCNAILEEITKGNLIGDIFIDKKDEQHAYLTCSIEDLNEWTPDPPECDKDPIARSSRAGHFMSILLNLFQTLGEFVKQYQVDLERRILYKGSIYSKEFELYENIKQRLGEEVTKPIYVMLADWKQSETTGVLLRSVKYWPEHHPNPANTPADSELDRRRVFESMLDPALSVTWLPCLEPVSVTLQFDNGAFEFIVPASALKVLELLIERNCEGQLTLDDNQHEHDIAVWVKQGVITESAEGFFLINSIYNGC